MERRKKVVICFVGCKRCAAANNKHIGNYNPEEPSNYTMCCDCNNLYAVPMTEALPYKDLKLCDVVPL